MDRGRHVVTSVRVPGPSGSFETTSHLTACKIQGESPGQWGLRPGRRPGQWAECREHYLGARCSELPSYMA